MFHRRPCRAVRHTLGVVFAAPTLGGKQAMLPFLGHMLFDQNVGVPIRGQALEVTGNRAALVVGGIVFGVVELLDVIRNVRSVLLEAH